MIRCVVSVGVVLALSSVAGSQVFDGASPSLTIKVPPETLSQSVDIHYFLEGPFGAYGSFVRPLPSLHSYKIEASHDGIAAETAKVIAYIPGCRFAVFTVPITKTSAVEKTLSCSALPTVSIGGDLVPKSRLPNKPADVAIVYEAIWACAFWGLPDCTVPQFQLTTVPLNADGTFEVTLPDCSQDPITSDGSFDASLAEFSENPTVLTTFNGATLRVYLRDPKTWNPVGFGLEPPSEFKAGSDQLAIKSYYPTPLQFRILNSEKAKTPVAK